jgi:acyl-coenzyme A synthetase/AMP-(fatty) acid ligase
MPVLSELKLCTHRTKAIIWMEAAKRLGIAYVAVAAGTVATVLAERLSDTRAAALVTSSELEPIALAAATELDAASGASLRAIVLTRLLPEQQSPQHESVASSHAATPKRVAASELLVRATKELRRRQLRPTKVLGTPADSSSSSEAISSLVHGETRQWVSGLWQFAAAAAVDASHPLFVLYTSGSTGRPKGIVHCHGGYAVGLVETCRAVFDLRAERRDPRLDHWSIVHDRQRTAMRDAIRSARWLSHLATQPLRGHHRAPSRHDPQGGLYIPADGHDGRFRRANRAA